MTTLSDRPLTIVAGGGSVPVHVARTAIRDGRRVLIVGIEGEADPEILQFPHELLRWGQIGRFQEILSRQGYGDIVLIGGVQTLPDYKRLKLDFGAVRILPKVLSFMSSGDNTILTSVVQVIESWGCNVIGAHEIAGDLVASVGVLTDKQPRSRERYDGKLAMTAARGIGALDAGQAAVAINGRIVALEAAEGTDGVLSRVAELRETGRFKWSGRAGVLAKCPKPQQDLRVDMPTIGPDTVSGVERAGLAGITIEAGRVMIIDRDETLRRADAAGVFILAVEGAEAVGR